jgi:hypothetical protein
MAPPETRANPLSGSWLYCTRLGFNAQRNAQKNHQPVVLKPQRNKDAWKRNNARKYRVFPVAKTCFLSLIVVNPMKKAASEKRLFMKPAQSGV